MDISNLIAELYASSAAQNTSSSGGNNNLFFIILIIVPILVIFYIVIKKRKGGSKNDKNSPSGNKLKSKEEADEVWLTIKRHLRETNERGKEVVDSYVIKRPDPINPKNPEMKQLKKNLKNWKKTNPEKYKEEKAKLKIQRRKKPAELYVVLFTTRNTKTGNIDQQRGIECEVVYKKVNKNQNVRTIVIKNEVDVQKEMKWIKPIKDKDDKMLAKQLKAEQKRKERKEQKSLKNKQKKSKN